VEVAPGLKPIGARLENRIRRLLVFTVRLSSPRNAVITDGKGVGTIVDDD
jgi:hypothetical protein